MLVDEPERAASTTKLVSGGHTVRGFRQRGGGNDHPATTFPRKENGTDQPEAGYTDHGKLCWHKAVATVATVTRLRAGPYQVYLNWLRWCRARVLPV